MNYSQLRLLEQELVQPNWLAVILDEGQYIKNPTSLTAKAACRYIDDGKGEGIVVSDKQIGELKETVFKPLEHYKLYRNEIVAGDVNPHYINPRQGLDRLQKMMDEYCGGVTVSYMTNEKLLSIGLKMFRRHVGLLSIGSRTNHQFQHMLHRPTTFDKLHRQPIQQILMGGRIRLRAQILQGWYDPPPHHLVPPAIDRHSPHQWVIRRNQPASQPQAIGGGIFR